MAARRNRDRDSGINNPGDETLNIQDRLHAIEEDPTITDEEVEPEDSPLHTHPEEAPDPPPEDHDMADPAPAAPGVLPGQLTALPLFDGDRGEPFVNWLEVVENAEQTYGLDRPKRSQRGPIERRPEDCRMETYQAVYGARVYWMEIRSATHAGTPI